MKDRMVVRYSASNRMPTSYLNNVKSRSMVVCLGLFEVSTFLDAAPNRLHAESIRGPTN